MLALNTAYNELGGTSSDVSGAGVQADFIIAEWGDFTDNVALGDYPIIGINPYTSLIESSSTPGTADLSKIQAQLDKLFGQVITAMQAIKAMIGEYERKSENDLVSQMPLYATIITELSKSMNTVPPSGAIAGIYANTDAARGVWKAPANISVNGIVGLTDDITHKEQENMNIHAPLVNPLTPYVSLQV